MKLNSEELILLKIEYDMSTEYATKYFYAIMTKKEQKKIDDVMDTIPNTSNQDEKDMYWDIILVDSDLKNFLENLLMKYHIDYNLIDLTEEYHNKTLDLDPEFIKEIDDYVNKILDVNKVLDRINKVGIKKINLFELSYLEKQSKKD